uniref:Lipase 1 n=1 Tax=Cacopsylla melanoneura TaxID=428564 RepID=A0A8D8S4H0_9HEMI
MRLQVLPGGFKIFPIVLSVAMFTLIQLFLLPVQARIFETENEVLRPVPLDPDYWRNFMEPDSTAYYSGVFPQGYHVKEPLQILKMWGQHGQGHNVTTEDGYIISLFRIKPKKLNAIPVLILHGFLGCPETHLMRGKQDLPIVLADAGFDVWLGSYRGSHHGRAHVNLTTQDEKFWNFSFHEHGYYDLPAMIDHILLVSGADRVSIVAHSMGNAVTLSCLATRPEYNDKIRSYSAMAPYSVVRVNEHLLHQARKMVLPFFVEAVKINKNSFFTDVWRRRSFNPFATFCWSFPRTCLAGLANEWGTPYELSYYKLMPVLMAYVPSGSSNKNVEHMLSLESGQFRQFDYGPEGNRAKYGTSYPPPYNLSNVRVPTSLYYGATDRVVPAQSLQDQARALPNVVRARVIIGYNHLDFLVASNTREVIDNPIIEDIMRAENVATMTS